MNVNSQNIKHTLNFFGHSITEVRIFNIKNKKGIFIGYYDINHVNTLIQDITPFNGKATIAININPINPDLFKNAPNCLQKGINAFSNKDVLRIEYLPIDIDPVKPSSDASSNAEELELGRIKGEEVINYLQSLGLPAPHLIAMSGNGYHIIYKLNSPLPTKEACKIKAILKHLNKLLSDNNVKIDTQIGDPTRLLKLYGTTACKGENTPDRPHRESYIESINNEALGIDIDELLQKIPYASEREIDTEPIEILNPGEIPQYIKGLMNTGIKHGARDNTLFNVSCHLHSIFNDENKVLSVLKAINDVSAPPLPSNVLKIKWRQGKKYKRNIQGVLRKRRIQWRDITEKPQDIPQLSLSEVRQQLLNILNVFISDPNNKGKILFIKVPPGTGKTHAIINLSKEINLSTFEPDDLKSKELEDAGFKYIRGREKSNLNNKPLCSYIEHVALLQSKGYKRIEKLLCKKCDEYKKCEYYKQYPRINRNALCSIVANHKMLFTAGFNKITGHNKIEVVVIDENIISQFIDTVTIDQDKLIKILGEIEYSEPVLKTIFTPIRNLFKKYESAAQGVSISGKALIKELGNDKFKQLLANAPMQKIPDDITLDTAPYNFTDIIIQNLKDNSENVSFIRTHGGTLQLIINIKQTPPKELYNYPIIYLDATGDSDIIRKLFNTEVTEVNFNIKPEGQLKIYQNFLNTNTSYSIRSKKGEEQLLDNLIKQGLVSDKKSLIISTADLESKLRELYPEAEFNHYNSGRGLNQFEHCNKVIIANAPKIDYADIVNHALALGLIESKEGIKLIYEYTPTGYVENNKELYIEVLKFNIEVLNKLLYQRREVELIQQLHRIRFLLKDAEIYINTNLPLPGIIPTVAISKKEPTIKKQSEFDLLQDFIRTCIDKFSFYTDDFFYFTQKSLKGSDSLQSKANVIYNTLITSGLPCNDYAVLENISKPTYIKYRNQYFDDNNIPVNELTLKVNNNYPRIKVYGDIDKAKEMFKDFVYVKQKQMPEPEHNITDEMIKDYIDKYNDPPELQFIPDWEKEDLPEYQLKQKLNWCIENLKCYLIYKDDIFYNRAFFIDLYNKTFQELKHLENFLFPVLSVNTH